MSQPQYGPHQPQPNWSPPQQPPPMAPPPQYQMGPQYPPQYPQQMGPPLPAPYPQPMHIQAPAPYVSVTKVRKDTSHTFHLLMTLFTCGMWGIFVWIPIIIWHKMGPRQKQRTRHY
jgi:hypothetical protein